MKEGAILELKQLKQYFKIHKQLTIKAVDGVSLALQEGEIFALVGESGSGKSTVAKTVMGLHKPTGGEIYFRNYLISDRAVYKKHHKEIQKNMQIIFQDSASALNHRRTVQQIIEEPLKIHRVYSNAAERLKKVEELLYMVGLEESYKTKYPYELSGGQRQRVSIARCLSLEPSLIVADEPIASLDVSIQAQIINLFQTLQRENRFTFLLIAHDLSMVRYISNRIGVMYRGKLVELAETEELFSNPLHPYTKSLLSAIPIPDPYYERQKEIQYFHEAQMKWDGIVQEVLPGHMVMEYNIIE